MFIEVALHQNRRAVIICASGKVFDGRRGQYRSIGPRVRRDVSNIGVVEWRSVFATEISARVERSNEHLRGGKTCKEISVLGRNIDLFLLDRSNDFLLFFGAPSS